MSKIRNIGRYKSQMPPALLAFVLLAANSISSGDLFIDVTPEALAEINKNPDAKLDHIKLALARPDKDQNPYQFNTPAVVSGILKASAQTNAIAKKAKTKTPEVLFSETGYLYVAGAKFNAKALTIQEIKAAKLAATPAPAPAENDDDGEGENEGEDEPKTEKKTRKKKGEQA